MPPVEPSPKQQIAERLKTANNILVTVSTNPSVDQLAAAIGFSLLLNKLGKHGTAVFSGQVPSTLEFLRPEQTLEKNTDSLRDFIVALDKAKADRLRYKVEDRFVKIFITPYRTSLSEKDLEFSQGDFNVDVVVALGVHDQKELDSAITAHGRILHDATVIAINKQDKGNIGTINWNEPRGSSLCELIISLSELLGENLLDAQIATALLTGIVAETERFSNDKTSPITMTFAARLMSAGANQQLIASKLQKPAPPPPPPMPPAPKPKAPTPSKPKTPPPMTPAKPDDVGALKIDHGDGPKQSTMPPAEEESTEPKDQIDIDTQGTLHRLDLERQHQAEEQKAKEEEKESRLMLEPPTLKSKLTANSEPEALDPSTDPLSLPPVPSPLLSHTSAIPQANMPAANKPSSSVLDSAIEAAKPQSQSSASQPTQPDNPPPPDPNAARGAVNEAFQSVPVASQPLAPIQALNAQRVDLGPKQNVPSTPVPPAPVINTPPAAPADLNLPPNLVPPISKSPTSTTDSTGLATPPPPVPPPMMPPPFGKPPDDVDDVPPQEPLAAL